MSDDYAKTTSAGIIPTIQSQSRQAIMYGPPRSAELTKYAANAMLATKISFMNELSQIAEKMDADIEQVRKGIDPDPRIGFQFITPVVGTVAHAFQSDVQALIHTANQAGARRSNHRDTSNQSETKASAR